MNWIDTNERLPNVDNDVFVISVTRGNYTFLATALYVLNDNKWYYTDKGEVGEEITDTVNGWINNIGVYVR